MRVFTVIGNRPQFVKLAAVSPLLRASHEETLVHTGQHHDRELSQVFFDELELPEPDYDLAIAGGSNTSQTSRMLAALEPLIASVRPDLILVYGDTNSTLAGALAAAQSGVPLAHVEAGLRSFDRAMPEEVNRVVCDALANLLLAPGDAAATNLANEGVHGEVVVTGDVMGDVVLRVAAASDAAPVLERFAVTAGEFLFVTAHRAANVDDSLQLAKLAAILTDLPLPAIFPVHPRTLARLEDSGLIGSLRAVPGLQLVAPLPYAETVALVAAAKAVLTDSGGLQKESVWLGTPCVTLRPSTEWVETAESGWNTITGLDADAVASALAAGAPAGEPPQLYGAGTAGAAVVASIERWHVAALERLQRGAAEVKSR
ncbi:MAG: non-hydrolyzing UDP-N-acetylglucosamine 2-epimerase [Solirubrobacterales bacterium]